MESRKQLGIILGVVFFAIALYVMVRVLGEDDESRVRKVVYAGVLAIERHDLLMCGRLISDAYEDSYGYNKAAILQFISSIFKGQEFIKVEIKQLKIEVKEAGAEADIGFKSYFKKRGVDEKIYYDTGKLKVYFQKEDRRWKVREIKYTGSHELLFIQGVA